MSIPSSTSPAEASTTAEATECSVTVRKKDHSGSTCFMFESTNSTKSTPPLARALSSAIDYRPMMSSRATLLSRARLVLEQLCGEGVTAPVESCVVTASSVPGRTRSHSDHRLVSSTGRTPYLPGSWFPGDLANMLQSSRDSRRVPMAIRHPGSQLSVDCVTLTRYRTHFPPSIVDTPCRGASSPPSGGRHPIVLLQN